MSINRERFDLIEFEIGTDFLCEASLVPTACLLVVGQSEQKPVYVDIIERIVPSGCRFILTWGDEADRVHDIIDGLLEARGGVFLNVVTTSHREEPALDVAWFLVNGTFPGKPRIRCIVGHHSADPAAQELRSILRSGINGSVE